MSTPNTPDQSTVTPAAKPKPPSQKGDHQNIARVALVLDILKDAGTDGLRLTDVVEASGLGVAVIHRLLAGLVTYGLVDHEDATSRYYLSLKLVSLTAAAIGRYGLARFSDGPLETLRRETEDTVYLSIISGDDSVCVDRREGAFPIRTLTLNVGDARPLGVGAGSLALLAFQSDASRLDSLKRDLARRESYGIADTWLLPAIEATQDRGFALNDGQLIQGMFAVGVPIRKADGTAIGALSVAAISDRLSDTRLPHIVDLLKAAAYEIEQSGSDVINSPIVKRQSRKTS